MNHWQATFLGLKQLPRELSGFEIEAFFTFTASERALIEARRGPSLKLGLALQIGFLRMILVGCWMRCASCRPRCGSTSVTNSASRPRIWHRCERRIGGVEHYSIIKNWPARRWAFIP
jgi:Domain of unknown function (DUF4158)